MSSRPDQLEHVLLQRVTTAATVISVAAVAVSAALAALAPAALVALAPVVLGVGVVVGLPHGAADHLVPFWLRSQRAPALGVLAVAVGYLVVAGVAWAALLLAPAVAFWAFVVVSAVHFGLGDLAVDDDRDHLRTPPAVVPARVLARGLVPLAVPLVAHSGAADVVLRAVSPGLPAAFPQWSRVLLLMLALAGTTVSSASAGRRQRWTIVRDDLVLVALFFLVPPLAAFGIYFAAWHAARHVARLLVEVPPVPMAAAAAVVGPAAAAAAVVGRGAASVPTAPPAAAKPLRYAARRYLAAAAVPTVFALAALAALTLGSPTLAGPALSLLLALTLPHLAIVALLDRARWTAQLPPPLSALARVRWTAEPAGSRTRPGAAASRERQGGRAVAERAEDPALSQT